MKKIIEEVLQVEEKVGLELKQARNEASEMRLAAEKEAAEQVADANRQARELIQLAAEDSKIEAERFREDKLKAAEQGKDAFLSENADKINGLIDNIVDIVLSGSIGKESD